MAKKHLYLNPALLRLIRAIKTYQNKK